jgi:hypothetical protein
VTSVAGYSPVAALEGRIRTDQVQLNDWTTCVSAHTSKGQAAIQKLSGEISAAKQQVSQALQAQASAARPPTASAPSRAGSVDVWA